MPAVPVTCVIPTRDRATMLSEAIDSALAQTAGDLEVVVVDDGSTDHTPDVLASYGDAIVVTHTPGLGVAAARNAGLETARSRYVALLDSDDVWHPEKVATQLEVMDADPSLGFTYTDYTVSTQDPTGGWTVVDTRRHEDEPTLRSLLLRNFTGTLTVMARRDVARQVGFDTALVRGSDYHFLLRVAAQRPFRRVPEVLADYRRHADSLTEGQRWRDAEARVAVLERLVATEPAIFDEGSLDAAEVIVAARDRAATLAAGA